MYIGIDLALRNIGMVRLNNKGEYLCCKLISSDPKKLNNEALLRHNYVGVWQFTGDIHFEGDKKIIGLEGLSFNSKSASIDLIAANHWMVRSQLVDDEDTNIIIIPPRSWQKSIITKEVLAGWSTGYPVIRAKRGMKLTKEQITANSKSKAAIRKLGKDLIYQTLPKNVKDSFQEYITEQKLHKDTAYDLADAYWIAKYVYDGKR